MANTPRNPYRHKLTAAIRLHKTHSAHFQYKPTRDVSYNETDLTQRNETT